MAATKKWVRFARWALPIALAFVFFGWRSYKFIESKRLSPPLIAAVKANNLESVRTFLERGADPNARDIPNSPTDFWALLKSIIKPDPSKRPEAFPSALILAAEEENPIEVAGLLLDRGANAKVLRPSGGTILTHILEPDYGSGKANHELFKLLLKHGADPNASFQGQPLLLMAFQYKVWEDRGERHRFEYLNDLLEHKADPNVSNTEGKTLLKLAMDEDQTDVIRRLLAAGADPNKKNDSRSPLLDSVQARNPEVVNMLLDKHADPNQVDAEGTSPLMVAAFNGDLDIVHRLLSAGATTTLTDTEGKTARQYAQDSPAVIALLDRPSRP